VYTTPLIIIIIIIIIIHLTALVLFYNITSRLSRKV
jgi:hypothetical protein